MTTIADPARRGRHPEEPEHEAAEQADRREQVQRSARQDKHPIPGSPVQDPAVGRAAARHRDRHW